MAKINISLPDDLLAQIESLAAELETSRSGLVQEATAQYVARVRDERAREARRKDIDEAILSARRLGASAAPFDSTASIRADRDRDGRKIGQP